MVAPPTPRSAAGAFPFGVYVVTDDERVAAAAVAGGAGAVQVRAPGLGAGPLRVLAGRMLAVCRPAGVVCVVNDRADVAIESGADGAHLGQTDLVPGARELLGPDRWLGISLDHPDQLAAAEQAGADYVGVTVAPTPTKPNASVSGLDGLRAVVARATVPVVAIGGITLDNAAEVVAAGAAGIAVISAVGRAPDPVAATRALVVAVGTAPPRYPR